MSRHQPTRVEPAESADVGEVAEIWRAGWSEAHLGRVPDELVAVRTAESFLSRAATMLPDTLVARVTDVAGDHVAGFVTVRAREVEQLYVGLAHRGSGIAAQLLKAGEDTIAAAGHRQAWLAVVAENDRARSFYERHGWRDHGAFGHQAPGPYGVITVPAHRYVKDLRPGGEAGEEAGRAEDRSSSARNSLIDTGVVRLRRPTVDDAPGVLAVHGDPRVYEHDPHETQTDLADARRFLDPILRHWADHDFGYWTVLVPTSWWPGGAPAAPPDDGDRVNGGMGGIQRYDMAGEPVLNVYFRLAPAIHGRGVAGLILREAVALAHRIAPGTDLVVRTRPANAAARWVAERAGFDDLGPEPGAENMQLLRLRTARGHDDR